MFLSDPNDEIFDDHEKVYTRLQAWPRVDTSETFYTVFLSKSESTGPDPSAVLLSSPGALVDFIVDCQKITQTKIQKILVSLPPHIHDGYTWKTTKIVKLMASHGKDCKLISIQYKTTGETYSDYLAEPDFKIKAQTIYKSS